MIIPSGSLINLGSYTLAVSGVKYHAYTLPIERPEFTTEKQKAAPELDGGTPNFDQTAGGKWFQIFTGCGDETSRPTVPDDAELDSILQRFDILHFDIEGTDTIESQIDGVELLSETHAALRSKFDQHFAALKQWVSIYYINTVSQMEDFSYLTSTGITMSGRCLSSNLSASFTNCLITNFEADVSRSYKNGPDGSSPTQTIYRTFKLEVEQRSIVAQSSATFPALNAYY